MKLVFYLTPKQAEKWENELRRLESDSSVTKVELRLFLQHPMECGHAVGNLLTCSNPPCGCVICNQIEGEAKHPAAVQGDKPEECDY